MKKISLQEAKNVAGKLKVNLNIIPLKVFRDAMVIELEHGKKYGKLTNVTNDNLLLTGKIALAHLIEYPDYYTRLEKMENQADRYWSTKVKPNILL
jgi:hypothetical protein